MFKVVLLCTSPVVKIIGSQVLSVQKYNLHTSVNSCAHWVRIGSSRQFPLSHCSFAVFHPSSPWREQSHEPLMIGFLFATAQPRLQLMNKSNEWHVITEQGVRDEHRVGASGRKPEIIRLENLRNEQELLCFDFFLCMWLSGAICAHRLKGK